MKFKALLLLAKVRGLFSDRHKYTVFLGGYSLIKMKEVYKIGFEPYYVNRNGMGFKLR